MADAKAQKEDLESKLAQLQSINKDEFRQGWTPHSSHAYMVLLLRYSMGIVMFIYIHTYVRVRTCVHTYIPMYVRTCMYERT